jgi:hypothetical protein
VEEYRLSLSGNRVLENVFGIKRKNERKKQRKKERNGSKIPNGEFVNLCPLVNSVSVVASVRLR